MDMRIVNYVLTGIGGQGIISLANVMANAALKSGTNVIVAETHGLSQRGGSVIVHVRMGDVEAPLIAKHNGDVMISLEPIEAARYVDYLKKGSTVLVEKSIIPPALPDIKVPTLDEIIEFLNARGLKPIVIPAVELAKKNGNPLGANMFMLGVLVGLGFNRGYFTAENVEEAIIENLRKPEKNVKVFRAGIEYGERLASRIR